MWIHKYGKTNKKSAPMSHLYSNGTITRQAGIREIWKSKPGLHRYNSVCVCHLRHIRSLRVEGIRRIAM